MEGPRAMSKIRHLAISWRRGIFIYIVYVQEGSMPSHTHTHTSEWTQLKPGLQPSKRGRILAYWYMIHAPCHFLFQTVFDSASSESFPSVSESASWGSSSILGPSSVLPSVRSGFLSAIFLTSKSKMLNMSGKVLRDRCLFCFVLFRGMWWCQVLEAICMYADRRIDWSTMNENNINWFTASFSVAWKKQHANEMMTSAFFSSFFLCQNSIMCILVRWYTELVLIPSARSLMPPPPLFYETQTHNMLIFRSMYERIIRKE